MKKRRKFNKRKYLILGISLCVIAIMASGYAILSQELSIDTNVKVLTAENYLWYKITNDNSSNLINEDGRYIFNSSADNNYITLNSETWRIISVEKDHSIRVANVNSTITESFDTTTRSSDSTDTYCYSTDSTKGCNAWYKGNISNDTLTGTTNADSNILTYLNTTYYNSLDESLKSIMVERSFNTGFVSDTMTFQEAVTAEQNDSWTGYVGLPTLTDLLKPNEPSITSVINTLSYSNYLINNSSNEVILTMTGEENSNYGIFTINKIKNIEVINASSTSDSTTSYKSIPVITLKPTTKVNKDSTQLGTSSNPYIVDFS